MQQQTQANKKECNEFVSIFVIFKNIQSQIKSKITIKNLHMSKDIEIMLFQDLVQIIEQGKPN